MGLGAAVPPRRLAAPSAGTARWPEPRPPLSPPPPVRPGCRQAGRPAGGPAREGGLAGPVRLSAGPFPRAGPPGSAGPPATAGSPGNAGAPAAPGRRVPRAAGYHRAAGHRRAAGHHRVARVAPVKNSLARRVSAASSRRPSRCPLPFAFISSPVCVRVLMELVHSDVVEHGERVVGEDGQGRVEGDQVGRDRRLR